MSPRRPIAVFPLLARSPGVLRGQHVGGRRQRQGKVRAGAGGLYGVSAPSERGPSSSPLPFHSLPSLPSLPFPSHSLPSPPPPSFHPRIEKTNTNPPKQQARAHALQAAYHRAEHQQQQQRAATESGGTDRAEARDAGQVGSLRLLRGRVSLPSTPATETSSAAAEREGGSKKREGEIPEAPVLPVFATR